MQDVGEEGLWGHKNLGKKASQGLNLFSSLQESEISDIAALASHRGWQSLDKWMRNWGEGLLVHLAVETWDGKPNAQGKVIGVLDCLRLLTNLPMLARKHHEKEINE